MLEGENLAAEAGALGPDGVRPDHAHGIPVQKRLKFRVGQAAEQLLPPKGRLALMNQASGHRLPARLGIIQRRAALPDVVKQQSLHIVKKNIRHGSVPSLPVPGDSTLSPPFARPDVFILS